MEKLTRRDFVRLGAAMGLAAGGILSVGKLENGARRLVFAAPGPEKPRLGGTLRVVSPGNPSTLNQMLTLASVDSHFCMFMYSGLVSFTWPDARPLPDVADTWEASADRLTYTFRLNPNARWSDGNSLTADDVKFSYEMNRDFAPRGASNFAVLESIQTPDPRTVVFKLKSTWGPFNDLWQFGSWWGPIIPKHVYAGTDIRSNPRNLNPVTSGPFRLRELARGSHAILEKNPYYWKKDESGQQLPYLDAVIIQIIPDAIVAVQGFLKGTYHHLTQLPAIYQKQLAAARDVRSLWTEHIYAAQDTLMFNLRRPITGNVKVRRAIAHVIEKYKDVMIRDARAGLSQKSYTVVAPVGGASWAYVDPQKDRGLPYYGPDIGAANSLLDEAGYKRDASGRRFKVSYLVCNCREEEVKMGEILREAFAREVGITLEVVVLDNAAWVQKTFVDWDFDMSIRTLDTGPDPNNMYGFYHRSQIRPLSFANSMGYDSPAVSGLIEEAAARATRQLRRPLYREIQRQLLTDLPAIWISTVQAGWAWRSEFAGPGAWMGMRDEGWPAYLYAEWSRVWWRKGRPVGG